MCLCSFLAFKLNIIELTIFSSSLQVCLQFSASSKFLASRSISILEDNYLKCSQNHLIYAFCLRINFLITKWLKFFPKATRKPRRRAKGWVGKLYGEETDFSAFNILKAFYPIYFSRFIKHAFNKIRRSKLSIQESQQSINYFFVDERKSQDETRNFYMNLLHGKSLEIVNYGTSGSTRRLRPYCWEKAVLWTVEMKQKRIYMCMNISGTLRCAERPYFNLHDFVGKESEL